MGNRASGDERWRAPAWLDGALEWARAEERTGLVNVLNPERPRLLFDSNYPESAARVTVDGSASGAAYRGV